MPHRDTASRRRGAVGPDLPGPRAFRAITDWVSAHREHGGTYPKQIEVHVFYLAFGYFISYLPYALVVKALSSAVVPGIDGPVGAAVVLVAAALGPLLACARSGHRVTVVSARVETHALGAAMTDFAHAVLQDAGIIPHRHRSQRTELCRRADAIHHAMRLRPVEQFS